MTRKEAATSSLDLVLLKEHHTKPSNSLILRRLVADLMEHDRLAEARFYARRLEATSIDFESLKLIFILACRSCDQSSAARIEKLLQPFYANSMIRDALHVRYYLTFRDPLRLKYAAMSLANQEISDLESIGILFESVRVLGDADTCLVALHHHGRSTRFSPDLEKALKKILLRKIVSLIAKAART